MPWKLWCLAEYQPTTSSSSQDAWLGLQDRWRSKLSRVHGKK